MSFSDRFLHMKHWKLFVLSFAVPFASMIILFIVMVLTMAIQFQSRQQPDISALIPFFVLLMLGTFSGAFFRMAWQWAVATRLQRFMHPHMRPLAVQRYKIFALVPPSYIALISILFPMVIIGNLTPSSNFGPSIASFLSFFAFLFIGNLLVIFCAIYCLYFTSKTLVSAELQREAHFSDYIGDFFLIWLYPIGIWFIQPRINALVDPSSAPPKPKPIQRVSSPQKSDPPKKPKPPGSMSDPINQEDFFNF
jgi:hypothetical protein